MRVLQEGSLRRAGGGDERPVDVRVVATTARPLDQEIEQGRFRRDLYSRFHVGRIHLPPLHQRREDLPQLVAYFLAEAARELACGELFVDRDYFEMLHAYPWPGNVRELRGVLRRSAARAQSAVLSLEELPDEIIVSGAHHATRRMSFFQLRERRCEAFERSYLLQLIRQHAGDVAAAARQAQVPRTTLYRLLTKHRIHAALFQTDAGAGTPAAPEDALEPGTKEPIGLPVEPPPSARRGPTDLRQA